MVASISAARTAFFAVVLVAGDVHHPDAFDVVNGSAEPDSLTALDLYRQFRLSHGVDWPDRQIAATALVSWR